MQATVTKIMLLLVLFWGLNPLCATNADSATEAGEIAERVRPSVVLVTGYMGQQSKDRYVDASGFFIDKSGFLVSALNVFTDPKSRRLCERYSIRMFDGRELQARTYAADPILNLLLLKVIEPGTYPVLDDEEIAVVRPGDAVLALGGSKKTADVSWISGVIRARPKTTVYGGGLGDMFIDSHMRLPVSAYGGPLLSKDGKIIGVNTPNIYRPTTGVVDTEEGHTLPMRIVKSFFKISQNNPLSDQRWIGLSFRPLTPDEKTKTHKLLGQMSGVFVEYVWPQGPAGQSDIRVGDILFSMNGKHILHLHQLNQLLSDGEVGTDVGLSFLRQGKGVNREVILEKRPAWAGYVNW